MTVDRRYCIHHPDRLAIGVCVETKKPICGECSTRYNGVNYSREGLEILKQRRLRESGTRPIRVGLPALLAMGALMAALAFAAYWLLGVWIMGAFRLL